MAITEDICNHALTLIGAPNQITDITATGDSADTEIKCNAIFADNFKTLLEEHNWRFATKRAEVTALVAVTGITAADPGVVTAAAHGFADGTKVRFTGLDEMTVLNLCSDPAYFLTDDSDTDTFEIQDEDAVDYDTSGYDAETTGGYVFAIPEHEFTYRITKPTDALFVIREKNGYTFREEGGYLVTDNATLYIEYIEEKTIASSIGYSFKKLLELAMARDLAIPIRGSKSLAETMEARFEKQLRRAKMRNANIGTAYESPDGSWVTSRY
jgi:hypothetical protein